MKISKSYYLDKDIHDWLAKIAKKDSRSSSGQLSKILRDIMKEEKNGKGHYNVGMAAPRDNGRIDESWVLASLKP